MIVRRLGTRTGANLQPHWRPMPPRGTSEAGKATDRAPGGM